ncbi:MAG TPA: DUF58 domain-containing protein [Chloroflexota bacterium]|nr:DUF58 domain-containing protein [Chloroflexota bacterium]
MAGVITLLAIVLLIGIIRGQASLIMLVSLLLVTTVGLAAWSRWATQALSYRRFFDPPRIFPGEETTYVVEVVNRRVFPLPWVRIEEHVPAAIVPVRGAALHTANSEDPAGRPPQISSDEGWVRRRTVSLGRNERVVLRQRFTCRARGHYVVGPTAIETGDPLGMFPVHLRAPETRSLIVYPRLAVAPPIDVDSRFPHGGITARPPALEDPARFVGIRDYLPGDPRRLVDWKASARRLKLQTRVFAPTTQPTCIVVLNVQTMEYTWQGYDATKLEAAIGVAAAAVRDALAAHEAVGLAVNACGADMEDFQVFLRPNRRPSQLEDALSLLARLSPIPTMGYGQFIHQIARQMPFGASILAITAYLDEEGADNLAAIRRRGHDVSLCFLGEESPVPLDPRIRSVFLPHVEFEYEQMAGSKIG